MGKHSPDRLTDQSGRLFESMDPYVWFQRTIRYVEATNAWSYIAPKGPQPEARVSYSICKRGSLLYLFGGKSDGGEVLSDLWVFDLDSESWIEETEKTYVADAGLYATGQLGGIYGHSCAIVGDAMVLFGGFMKVTQRASSATAILDLETYQWTSGKVGPPARLSHASVEANGSLYIFGGVNEKFAEFTDVWEYSVVNDRWNQLTYRTSIPGFNSRGGVFDHSAVALDNKMLSFFGQGYGQQYDAALALPLYNM